MIISVTPAPAVDWTIHLEQFQLGEVNRGTSASREASGKGLNVSWALHRAGIDTLAIFPAGLPERDFFISELTASGLRHHCVPTSVPVRTNITLTFDSGPDTKINTNSEALSSDDAEALLDSVTARLEQATVLLSTGSLPPGLPESFHREVIALGRGKSVKTVLDTSGAPLQHALAASPDLVKPNLEELAEVYGRPLLNLGDVERACQELVAEGVGSVLASLGGDGAMYVTSSESLWGRVANVSVVNTVGAGDAMLAGFLASNGADGEALASALVWGASAVESATTLFEVQMRHADNVRIDNEFDRLFPLESDVAKIAEVGA